MIELTFNPDEKELYDRIRARGAEVIKSLVRAMDLSMLKLQRHVVADKLSGQVLNRGANRPGHSGGTLAASIRKEETVIVGTEIVGQVLGGGGDAFYGRFHEYGTSSVYQILPVSKQALRFIIGGKVIIRRAVMHPPIKERSFMRSSLADMRQQIVDDLRSALKGAA